MSKVWKWILGILIVLVVLAVAVGAVFIVRNRMLMIRDVRPQAFGNSQQTRPNLQATPAPNGTPSAPGAPGVPGAPAAPNRPFGFNGQKGPMMPYGFNGRNNPMFGNGNRGPMMGRGGFSHFGMFGMGFFLLGGLLRLVVPLGILVLVAFLFYQMGKRAGINSVAAPAPVVSNPAPAETTAKGRKVAKS